MPFSRRSAAAFFSTSDDPVHAEAALGEVQGRVARQRAFRPLPVQAAHRAGSGQPPINNSPHRARSPPRPSRSACRRCRPTQCQDGDLRAEIDRGEVVLARPKLDKDGHKKWHPPVSDCRPSPLYARVVHGAE